MVCAVAEGEETAREHGCGSSSVSRAGKTPARDGGEKKRWQLAATVIRIALLTGMRSGEISRLVWER